MCLFVFMLVFSLLCWSLCVLRWVFANVCKWRKRNVLILVIILLLLFETKLSGSHEWMKEKISHSKNQISFTVNSKKVSTLASICKKLLWCVSSAPRVCGAGLSIWSIYFKTPNNKIVYQELQIWRETIEIYWKLSDKSRNGKKCTFIWRDRGSGIFWAVSCAIL